MKTINELLNAVEAEDEMIRQAKERKSVIIADLIANHSPIQIGDIIDTRRSKISVTRVEVKPHGEYNLIWYFAGNRLRADGSIGLKSDFVFKRITE